MKTNSNNWYEHEPTDVVNSNENKITILWNVPIQTDREIRANRPDIVIKNHKNKTCQLIDVSVPSDYNIAKKECEKLSKYCDLKIECQRMWNMKCKVIPIVIGATGVVSKEFCKYTSNISEKLRPDQIQKTAILGTAYILRKLLTNDAI